MVQPIGNETQEAFQCSEEGNQPKYVLYSFMTLATLNIALSITASFGNILILVALHKESSLHPPSKLLLRFLAFSDLCVGLISQPVFASYLIRLSAEGNKSWDSTNLTAVLRRVTGIILGGVSLCTMTTISVDRLLALLLRLRYRQVVALGRVRAVVVIFWLVYIVIGVVGVWYNMKFSYAGFIGTFINLAISTFCYTKIYVTLRHQQLQVQEDHQQRQPNESTTRFSVARYKRTVSSALCVHFSLVVCYIPSFIVTLIRITRGQSPSLNVAGAVSMSLVLFNSSLNPVLYCWRIREVKRAAKETIRKICCFLSFQSQETVQ